MFNVNSVDVNLSTWLGPVMASKRSKNIEELEGDPKVLEREGWYLVTFYQSHHSEDCVMAHQKAIETASQRAQQVGIRSFTYNTVTYYEVWSRA